VTGVQTCALPICPRKVADAAVVGKKGIDPTKAKIM